MPDAGARAGGEGTPVARAADPSSIADDAATPDAASTHGASARQLVPHVVAEADAAVDPTVGPDPNAAGRASADPASAAAGDATRALATALARADRGTEAASGSTTAPRPGGPAGAGGAAPAANAAAPPAASAVATASAPDARPLAPPLEPRVLPPWVERVLDAVKLGQRRDGAEMRVSLEPQGLGAIEIHLRVQGDGVRAVLLAEHEGTRALLAHQQRALSDALERSDLRLASFSVDVGTGDDSEPAAPEEDDDLIVAPAVRRRALAGEPAAAPSAGADPHPGGRLSVRV
ncbi:MAG TPA: flagellar hook-length control protein FliK [Candidatus Binatia bacterium]|nr:flagellar hook-length control protein FliK [Candidatus Binatia bacterium]